MLDPQARALLDLMAARAVPPTHTLSVAEARRTYRDRRAVTQPDPPPVAQVRDGLRASGPAGDIPLRLYRGTTAPEQGAPALVYFHGGGWVIGDLDTHDTLCRTLANEAACVVVAVDYRMGPEHRFPGAPDDCLAAARWVHAQAGELGIDASRIALGGDSAGGNLAAVVALALRDAGDAFSPVLQLLIYPATDMRAVAPSHTLNGDGYLLTRETIAWFRGHYMGDAPLADWRASPLLHAQLGGLPPALVLTAGYDPLRDEGRQYADALSAAGTPTQYICFERQIHGFILMGRVLDEAHTATSLCALALRRAFAPAAA
jgi:acetyl esterase